MLRLGREGKRQFFTRLTQHFDVPHRTRYFVTTIVNQVSLKTDLRRNILVGHYVQYLVVPLSSMQEDTPRESKVTISEADRDDGRCKGHPKTTRRNPPSTPGFRSQANPTTSPTPSLPLPETPPPGPRSRSRPPRSSSPSCAPSPPSPSPKPRPPSRA